MKLLKRLSLALLVGALCVSAAAADTGFNAGLEIDRETEGQITVTVQDSSVLKEQKPTLTIPCAFAYAEVTFNGAKVDCTLADGNISFTVAAGGTYIIKETNGTTDEPDTPSGSSGGSSGVAIYTITVSSMSNGTVTASKTSASKGTTVTLTVTPDEGYELDSLTVTKKNGEALTLTDKGDGKYTFTMPASKVTVAADFAKVEEQAEIFFTDVPADAWYTDAVAWAVEQNITTGTGDATFSPDVSCTRAEMATFLWRAAGSPAPTTSVNPFTDVESGAYYYDAVIWAVENGITNGTSATTFSPDDAVTRGQTVTFLCRYAGSPAVSGGNNFTDVSADAYYADAVQWAVANEVTNGTSATTFSPENDCTRAQIVTFMYRDLAE